MSHRLAWALLLTLTACADADAPAEQTGASGRTAQNCAGIDVPRLLGRVSDHAEFLSPADESRIGNELAAYDAASHHQIVLVTVRSLAGKDVATVGQCIGNRWGIGDATRNDGIIMLVAPNERRAFIGLGRGFGDNPDDPRVRPAIHAMTSDLVQGKAAQGISSAIAVLERTLP